MLRVVKILQTAWTAGLLYYTGDIFWNALLHGGSAPTFHTILSFVTAFYLVSSVFVFMDKRWAWICSIICLMVIWLIWFLHFAVNFYEFLFGTLYQDSPATAIVLMMQLVPTLGPSSIIIILMYLRRHKIRAIIAGAPAPI